MMGVFYFPPIENRTEAEDAYWYARDVEVLPFRQLLHPHHRLYHPFAKGVFLVSGAERSFDVLVVLSAVLAGSGLFVFYWLVRRQRDCGPWQSLAWTGCLAFSYGYWRYAREVEVYAMGWLGCLLAVWFLFEVKGSWRKGLVFAVMVVLVLNVHRALGPPLLVMGLAYFLHQRQWRVALGCAGFGLVGYLAVEASFGAVSIPKERGAESSEISQFFSEDALRSVGEERRKGRSLKLSSLPKAAVGLGVSLMGGSVLMSSDEVFEFFSHTLFPYRFMEEEKMMAEGVSAWWVVPWFLGVAIVVILLIRVVLDFILKYRKSLSRVSVEVWAVAAGFFSYAGMIVIFEPGNPEMWLLGLPLFWLMVVVLSRGVSCLRVGTLAVNLVLTSYVGGMALLSDKGSDYHDFTSSLVRRAGSDGDLYLMGTQNVVHKRYVNYTVGVETVVVRIGDERLPEFYELIRGEIEDGRRVFVHETLSVLDPALIAASGLRFHGSGDNMKSRGGGELIRRDDD